MNPTIYKLKLVNSQSPIHKGQILPLCKDKLKINENDSLNHAFYHVNSVSRLKSYAKKNSGETYKISMIPVEWDEVGFKWFPAKTGTVSPHPFDISISSEELYDTFGVRTKSAHFAGETNDLNKKLESVMKDAGLLREFKDKYSNWDFGKMFLNLVKNHAKGDLEALTEKIFNKAFTVEKVKKLKDTNLSGGIFALFKTELSKTVMEKEPEKDSQDIKETPEAETFASRTPVGEKIVLKRQPIPSFEELTKQVVQDPSLSTAAAEDNVRQYLQTITSLDEMIEDDGKITGIKIHRK